MNLSTVVVPPNREGGFWMSWARRDPSVSTNAKVIEAWRFSTGMGWWNHWGGLISVRPSHAGLHVSSLMRVMVEVTLPSESRSTGTLWTTTLVYPSWGTMQAPVPKGEVRMDRYRYTWLLVGLPAKVKTKLWARRELHLPERRVTWAVPPPWAWLMAVRSVHTISAGSSFLARVATSSGWARIVNLVFRRADWFAGCARGGVLEVGAADDCEGGGRGRGREVHRVSLGLV